MFQITTKCSITYPNEYLKYVFTLLGNSLLCLIFIFFSVRLRANSHRKKIKKFSPVILQYRSYTLKKNQKTTSIRTYSPTIMLNIRSKLFNFNTKPFIFNQFRLASTLPNIQASAISSGVKPIDGDELKEQIIKETQEAEANLELVKYAIDVQFKKNNIKVSFSEYFDVTNNVEINDELDYHELIKNKIKLKEKLRWKTSLGCIGFKNAAKRQPEAATVLCKYVSNKIATYLASGDLIQLKKQVVDSQSGKLNKDGFTTNSNTVIKKKAPLYFSFKGIATTKQAFMQALLGPEGEELAPYIDVVADKTGTKHGGNRGKSVRRV